LNAPETARPADALAARADTGLRRELRATIANDGFAVLRAAEFPLIGSEAAWRELIDDWDHLKVDEYMADGGRYRLRRFGRFLLRPDAARLHRLPHGTVFQTRAVNGFAGGIDRDFAPLRESTFANNCLRNLIHFDFACFGVQDLARLSDPWEVWVHQIRIQSADQQDVAPAPEGIHHDGHDFIAMHLIGRANVNGGRSRVYDDVRNELHSCMLVDPMDTIYADDHRVMHSVDPISAADVRFPAHRDVLIIDYDHRPHFRTI